MAGSLFALVVYGETDVELLKERAAQGDPEALNTLGTAHVNGEGVAQSYPDALKLYKQAAVRGLAAAWFNLGMMHELGRGVTPDLAQAFACYLKAAERGFAPAQFNVGNMYANGFGVKEDLLEAALWFRQAADRGVPEAQFNLGLAYELGRGVRVDEVAAQRWYQAAATQGNARAQFNLALMLEEGRGAAPDLAGALNLYRLAAMQNFGPAQNNLGILLAEGRGVAIDLVEAYTWITLAAENGVTSNIREMVASQLSAEALIAANVSIAEMRSKFVQNEAPPAEPTASKLAVAPSLPSNASAPVAAEPAASELSSLQNRLATAEAESKSIRAENVRLAEAARLAEENRLKSEQRLAVAEESARVARIAASDAEASRPAFVTTTVDLKSLAAADPRIAKLMNENVRLNDEVSQSTLQLAELRITQEREKSADDYSGSKEALRESENKVAELTRRIAVLRRTVDKLAEESRWNAEASGNLNRLEVENQQLKSARRRGR